MQAHVVGLKSVEYMDSLQDRKRLTEQGDSITFSEELDRIYLSTPDTLEVCPAFGIRKGAACITAGSS